MTCTDVQDEHNTFEKQKYNSKITKRTHQKKEIFWRDRRQNLDKLFERECNQLSYRKGEILE